ncbi:hypothetical protein [Litorimonas haliclonae]|uniref:hypothetical protein n=1 Tax=Litorimonas haliclonae TaxID=2081977 RepID=UPI0039EEA7FC
MSNEYNQKSSGGKIAGIAIGAVVIIGVAVAALYLVDVDQTEEARLPDVDVAVEDGNMPEFDADVADVDVGTTETEVDVPTVDVESETVEVEVPTVETGTEETTVDLPTIDVDKPDEDSPDGDEDPR